MSEKDFDKQIREKLEAYEVDYPPESWNKFKNLLPVPWYQTFFKTYGGWILGGLSTLALLFNVFTSSQVSETEKSNNIGLQVHSTDTLKETQSVTRIDTIYVEVIRYLDRIVYKENEDLTLFAKKGGVDSTLNLGETILETNKEDLALNDSIASKPTVFIEEEEVTEKEVNTEKPTRQILQDTSKLAIIESEKSKSFWKNIIIRPGIETDFINLNSYAFGPIFEFPINSRFSINTGISISNSKPNTFKVPKDFNQFTGKDFDKQYDLPKPPGPVPGNIKDINIETSRIRMPIYLTYYVPVTYNLNFLFSTGTKLDLKVSENVSYINDAFGNNPFKRLENEYKPKVFNNFYYGMGLQYRYKSVYGSLTPYFEFPFSKPYYMITTNKFGINAGLKFSL